MELEKIDPTLLATFDAVHALDTGALVARRKAFCLSGGNTPAKPLSATVFLHCAEDADLGALAAFGVRVNQATGTVRTAFVPLHALGDVSDHDGVHRITSSRYRRPTMDVASEKVNVTKFVKHTKLTGKGVVFGLIDSGIDPTHPAFAGRILRIWDQEMHGQGVKEGNYGMELRGNDLLASRDFLGHGTHCAGIATGRDAVFGGVAPEADLVVVKTDFNDAHIADGARYIFRVAAELGRPAVINLSLGGHSDAHDGSDEMSRILDQLSGPGRIVCCAAGNEGTDNIHAQVTLQPGEAATIPFKVPRNVPWFALNGWYPGAAEVTVSLVTPTGISTPPRSYLPGTANRHLEAVPNQSVSITTPSRDLGNQDFNPGVMVSGADASSMVLAGTWKLRVTNTSAIPARFDVWMLSDEGVAASFTGSSVSDRMKVGSPGTAASAITVAAYTTKVQWTDVAGVVMTSGEASGTLCDFSSPGPLRNETRKPDITAPGSMIVSSLSSFSTPDPRMTVDALHVGMQGTSMATPFVSGLVACLLQRNPTLDPAAAKVLLRNNSAVPGSAVGVFDPRWGFGLINASEL